MRLRNHEGSARAKANGAQPARNAQVSVGDIVHVKSDGSKHKAREFYLIMSIDIDQSMAYIQTFCGSTLRKKQYKVKLKQPITFLAIKIKKLTTSRTTKG